MKADEAFPLPGRRADTVPSATLRTSRWRGVRSSRWAGWLFVLPALVAYAAFVLVPLALTVQYSTLRWNGIGPSTFVGIDNYVRVLTDPDLLGIIAQRVQARSSSSAASRSSSGCSSRRSSGASRPGTSGRRARTVLFLPQVIPLVAAGIMWSWLLVQERPRQPGAAARSASAASRAPGWRTSDWRCPRSASSAPGSSWACARSCC